MKYTVRRQPDHWEMLSPQGELIARRFSFWDPGGMLEACRWNLAAEEALRLMATPRRRESAKAAAR